MSALAASARGPRRWPVVVVVVVAIAVGVGAGRSHVTRVARPVAPAAATELPASGALSTAWYCPGLPAGFSNGDQTVTLSNLGPAAAVAKVTVFPDDAADPVERSLTVPRESVRTFDRATLRPVATGSGGSNGGKAATRNLPKGPIVVEPFSSEVMVSAGLESDNALATVPCATTAATDWYFAAGTTVRGVSQWIVLDNPFAADARVDISLRTDAGLLLLPALSGVDVAGRSRVVIPIHDNAVRQVRVAVEVHATVGQVVASQTLQFAAASGPPGVATSIGALAPASAWWFTSGDTRPDASEWVAIADVGELDARVNVQAQAGTRAIVRPVALTVPSGGVSLVQVGGCSSPSATCLDVPDDAGYVLEVQSDSDAPIVAQTLSRFSGEHDGAAGAATSMGSTAPARHWVVPRTRAAARRSTTIALANTSVDAAHLEVQVVFGGRTVQPAAMHLTLASGTRVRLPLNVVPLLRRADAAVVISSDIPIFVESTIYAEQDATRAPGIPER